MGELGTRLLNESGNVGHSLPTVTRACALIGGEKNYPRLCRTTSSESVKTHRSSSSFSSTLR